jgi:hypothetical protein
MKTQILMAITVFVALSVFFTVTPSRGDEIFQLSGTVLTVGNDAGNCNPSPCAIVVDFTAQVLFADISSFISLQGVANTFNYTVQSSLGNSSGSGQTLQPTLLFASNSEDIGYFVVPGFPGEVDLNFHIVPTADGFEFQPNGALFFSCLGSPCSEDFIMPQSGLDHCFSSLQCSGVTYPVELLGFSATQVPESSIFGFILSGTPLFAFIWFRDERRRTR